MKKAIAIKLNGHYAKLTDGSCLGMAILSMDLDTHGYPTRLGKGMERISAHGSVDMDTHEQLGWARL